MKTPLMGFPKRYASMDPPTAGPWFDAAKRAYKLLKEGGIVALYGGRGTGKTFMSYDLAHQSLDFPDPHFPRTDEYSPLIPRPAIYRTAMEIFLQIRDTFRKDSDRSELEVMNEFAEAALLVIDEAQERGETEFENQKLTAIIDARYRQCRPTIIVGNYDTKTAFAASISASIVSRIQECGGAIHCNWPSFRSPASKP